MKAFSLCLLWRIAMFIQAQETSMKKFAIFAGAGLMALGTIGAASAQPASGTPNSPFPYAAPHEITTINGVPCRTVLHPDNNTRVPVACASPMAGMTPVAQGDVVSTGSIAPAPGSVMMGGSVSGTPDSAFPYAAPHEIRTINGVPCRTVLHRETNTRVPVACAQ
jgi:hypothetical protein